MNALEDFSVAMTMYTIAGMALSEDEFARAAQVSLGKALDKDVVKTVFRIFDKDGMLSKCIIVFWEKSDSAWDRTRWSNKTLFARAEIT